MKISKKVTEKQNPVFESEIFAERKRRFLLVIKARWAIIASYFIYGVFVSIWFAYKMPEQTEQRIILYGVGLLVLVTYNAILHYSYEKLSTYRIMAQLQMITDIVLTTIIIYYTGGAVSWFWSTYLLIILQSAFLFDRKAETLEIAIMAGLAFGMLTIIQQNGIISYDLALLVERYAKDATYESMKIFWVIGSSLSVAFVAIYLMGVIRQREHHLAHKSVTDGLTGLYNHSYFHKRLRSEMERANRYKRVLSLVLFDIDDFKQYNDSFGHLEGDKIIKLVADVFKDNVRSADVDTVYRYGGEEFAILAPETSSQEIGVKESGAIAMAKRICAVIEETLPVSISAGVASYPHHADEPLDLFRVADKALYRAKERGKNTVVLASQVADKKIKGSGSK